MALLNDVFPEVLLLQRCRWRPTIAVEATDAGRYVISPRAVRAVTLHVSTADGRKQLCVLL